MSITSISTNTLSPATLTTLAQKVVLAVERYWKDDPGITMILQVVNADVTTLESILHRVPGTERTNHLLESDQERDSLFLAFRYYVYSWSFRQDEPFKAAAAKRLLEIMKGWSNDFLHSGYARESAEMSSFFLALETPSAREDLALIEADSWLAAVQLSQQTFEHLYITSPPPGEENDIPLLKEARKQLAQSLDALLQYMELRTRGRRPETLNAAEQINRLLENNT